MNSQKITNVASPVNSADAARLGDIIAPRQTHSVTGTATLSAGDIALCNATSAAFTVTLPTAPADGTPVTIIKIDASQNIVTFAAGGSDTIAGTSGTGILSPELTQDLDSVELVYDHANTTWRMVARIGSAWQSVVFVSGLSNDGGVADQTGIIQAAESALPTSGGTLVFPAGVFGCNYSPSKAAVVLLGQGCGTLGGQAGATTLQAPSGSSNAHVVNLSQPACEVRDMDISAASRAGDALYLNAVGCRVEKVVLLNGTFAALNSGPNAASCHLHEVRTSNGANNLTKYASAGFSVTNGSTTLTDSNNGFTTANGVQAGCSIAPGSGVPPGTRIVSVTNNSTVVMSQAATATTASFSGSITAGFTAVILGNDWDITQCQFANGPSVIGGNTAGTGGSMLGGAVHFIYSQNNLQSITAVSVTGNPTTITVTAHGLISGQTVTISGATGSTAINGTWTVTVTGTNTFTIPVSNTNAYTGSGVVQANNIPPTLTLEAAVNGSDIYLDSAPAAGAGIVHTAGTGQSLLGVVNVYNNQPNVTNAAFYIENDSSKGISFTNLVLQQPASGTSWLTMIQLAAGNNPNVKVDSALLVTASVVGTIKVGAVDTTVPALVTGGTGPWEGCYVGTVTIGNVGTLPARTQGDMLFGNGYDGQLNFDGSSTVTLGDGTTLTPSGGAYTLTRNIQATSILVQAAAINTSNFVILFTQWLSNAGQINNNGAGGSAGTGGVAIAAGTLATSASGGNGGAANTAGAAGGSVTNSAGCGAGGTGGSGNGGANLGGAAGAASYPSAAQGGNGSASGASILLGSLPQALSAVISTAAGTVALTGGAGGGGGGGGGTGDGPGAGGGAGGGIVIINGRYYVTKEGVSRPTVSGYAVM